MQTPERAAQTPQHHRQLKVWMKSIDLAVEVFRLTRKLPSSERFGLFQQMRAAATSIAANIAEGKGRTQPRDYARFIGIARGSAYELDTYVVLSQRLDFFAAGDLREVDAMLDEVRRMLTGLLRRLTPYQRPA